MRHLQGPAAARLEGAERVQVDEALDPPMTYILGAAAIYSGGYLGFQRRLRARPLVLQIVASTPVVAFLAAAGIYRSGQLVSRLVDAKSAGPVGKELREICPEFLKSV